MDAVGGCTSWGTIDVQWISTCCATEIQIFRCDYLAVCDPPFQFISIDNTIGQFLFGTQAWAGFIIVWAVQGTVSITTIQCSLAEVVTVILQMRLYALYHGSKRLLVFMVTLFVAEVGIVLWILISTSIFSNGPSLTSINIFTASGSDLCLRNFCGEHFHYRIILLPRHGTVFRLCQPCICWIHMGPSFRFRGYFGFTFCLGWYRAF